MFFQLLGWSWRHIIFGKLLFPLLAVRAVDHIGLAITFYHFVLFKNDVVFEGLHRSAMRLKHLVYLSLTFLGIRFVIAVQVNFSNIELLQHFPEDLVRLSVAYPQATTELFQFLPDAFQFLMNKMDPAISFILNAIQNVTVEHEHGYYQLAGSQCMVEPSVVM